MHPTRRTFLKSASVAAATSLAIPAVFAQQTPSASADDEKLLRFGLIGMGHRMRLHIPVIKSFSKDAVILAACDLHKDRLARGVKQIGSDRAQAYEDYQKLLANPDINAVMISSPNVLHKEMVIAALEAGKHVVCEKPIATSLDDALAMKRAEEARPRQKVLYTLQFRHAPRYAEIRRLVESGRIGKPRHLSFVEARGDWNSSPDVWQCPHPVTGKPANWRHSHAATGGTLNEKSCHYFDLLHWFAGANPTSISCTGGIAVYRDGRETWDHALVTMTYPDGCLATHDLCMFSQHHVDVTLTGDAGTLHLVDDALTFTPRGGKPEPLTLPAEIPHGRRPAGVTERGPETAMVTMYADYIDAVKNNRAPRFGTDQVIAASQTAFLGQRSNQLKKELKWTDVSA